MAFGFGLFHGLGFAGGFLEAMSGLGGLSVWIALLAFSVGVVLGHQCVAAPLYGAKRFFCGLRPGLWNPKARARKIEIASSALIAAAGLYYLKAALCQLCSRVPGTSFERKTTEPFARAQPCTSDFECPTRTARAHPLSKAAVCRCGTAPTAFRGY